MLPPEVLIAALLGSLGDKIAAEQGEPVVIDVPRLVSQAQKGDREAVAALYHAHVHLIYRYIYFRVPTTGDAEDLTAEVFVRMVEGLPGYRLTGAPFEAWLYRIAASQVADFYRYEKRRGSEDLIDTLPDSAPTFEEQLEEAEMLVPLRRALRQLPTDQQTILLLRFVERKSHEEVAAMIGKSVTAVKSAQHRALTRLSELLGQDQKMRHYLRGTHE